MGLYLCLFDQDDEEIDGVEVGLYEDFNQLRDLVTRLVEKDVTGSVCPTLILHSDCDGEWSSADSLRLLGELEIVSRIFSEAPPTEIPAGWKSNVAKALGIRPANLLECFFDVDGEPLVAGLQRLARLSVDRNSPILFQ